MCKTACTSRDTLPDFKWCCNHVWPMMLNFARDMPELLKPRMSILPLISQISLRSTEFRKWWLLRVVVCIFLNQTQLSVCDILTEASGNVEKKDGWSYVGWRLAPDLGRTLIGEAKYAERIQEVPAFGPHVLSFWASTKFTFFCGTANV